MANETFRLLESRFRAAAGSTDDLVRIELTPRQWAAATAAVTERLPQPVTRPIEPESANNRFAKLLRLTLAEIQDERAWRMKALGKEPPLMSCVAIPVGVAIHRAALEASRDPQRLPRHGEEVPTAFCTPEPDVVVLAWHRGRWVSAMWTSEVAGGESFWRVEGERLDATRDEAPTHWRAMPPGPRSHVDAAPPSNIVAP